MKTTQDSNEVVLAPSTVRMIEDVSRFMAYSYWRGRFEGIPEGENKEAAITGFGNCDALKWQDSAKALLSMHGHIPANM